LIAKGMRPFAGVQGESITCAIKCDLTGKSGFPLISFLRTVAGD